MRLVEAVLAHIRDPESLSGVWERQWGEHVIRLCFAQARRRFTPRDMGIFERLTVAQESVDQVAAAMNVSVKTVYNVKHRVLAYMRDICRDLEGEA